MITISINLSVRITNYTTSKLFYIGCVILRSPKDIDGIYRFGRTEDFKNRLTNYNSANSDKMEVLFVFETKNTEQVESCVISQIKQFRYKKRKDFYQIDIDIIKEIISSCNQLTLKLKKKN